MDKRARYYKNKRYFESDDFKKSTGVKQGLRLCGNEDEIKVANQLSKFFKITFSKEGTFKTTSYVFNFLQPGEEFREYYNLYHEVLLLFSPYIEFESRTLDFVDKTLEEFDNRLDKVCVFLVSRDGDIETKINGLNTANKDSRIIVPFTYAEILQRDGVIGERWDAMIRDQKRSIPICPANAIKQNSNQVTIDERKCFGCGLCVSRCPVGALYIKNEKAEVNLDNDLPRRKAQPSSAALKEQERAITNLLGIKHTGNMIMESEASMNKIYRKIKRLPQEQQNLFARNILICLSNNATISRHGDVYLRMDGYYENTDKHGVVEVETGQDMLDVSRAILDDIAVLSARHKIPKEENSALAICLNLANRRTDYWQEVKDIKDVTGIKISTVTFAILLIFMWNALEIEDFDDFYIDVDDSSLRKEAEKILGRRIRISSGHEGMIENSK